jgi:hypothetical protein
VTTWSIWPCRGVLVPSHTAVSWSERWRTHPARTPAPTSSRIPPAAAPWSRRPITTRCYVATAPPWRAAVAAMVRAGVRTTPEAAVARGHSPLPRPPHLRPRRVGPSRRLVAAPGQWMGHACSGLGFRERDLTPRRSGRKGLTGGRRGSSCWRTSARGKEAPEDTSPAWPAATGGPSEPQPVGTQVRGPQGEPPCSLFASDMGYARAFIAVRPAKTARSERMLRIVP